MKIGSRLVLAVVAATVLAASLLPLISSKSSNPCQDCHSNYTMYLDILEGDAGNTLPTALNDGETLTVAVVLKVTCNAANYKVMSSITATLASQNGLFSIVEPTCSVGSLASGQTATATWQIRPVATGNDMMSITAQGVNHHGPSYFSDSYSPSPSIAVTKAVVDLPPAIALNTPSAGLKLTGGTDTAVSWAVTDEDKATCRVNLYYSTDDFGTVNWTIATGLPAGQGYTWNTPAMDSADVSLKATVVDKKGNFNETRQAGHFAIDSTAPSVLSVLPADQAKDVADSAILQVRFSEPVAEYSAQMAFSVSPNPGGVAWSWNAEQTVMTASHDAFDAQTTYSCSIGAGVKDLSSPGNTYKGTLSWSFTTPEIIIPVPSIVLSAPSGGERFYWGDGTNVTWTASGGTGNLVVNLSFSGNGTPGPFVPIANDLPNNGRYAIAAPELVSDACLIAATVHDQNEKEARHVSGLFSIAQNLSLVAELPPDGSSFMANNSTLVNWTATGGHGAVVVGLSFQPDANSTSQAVATDLPPSGSYRWTAPEANTDTARLILNAIDGWGRSVEVRSGPFTIFTSSPPPPPVKSNRPPVVLFRIDEKQALVGGLLTFDASGSFDQDGEVLYYLWDFGDGTGFVNTTAATVTHLYSEAGEYQLVLAVGDGRDRTAQSMTVHVQAPLAAPDESGNGWVMISFGMIVLIVGSVGVAYAALSGPGRTPSRPVKAAPASPPEAPPEPLVFDRQKCNGCGTCSKTCPARAITMMEGLPGAVAPGKKPRKIPNVDGAKCNSCEACVKNCVKGAISPGPVLKRTNGS